MIPDNSAAPRRVDMDQAYLEHYPTPQNPSASSVSLGLQVVQKLDDDPGDSGGSFQEGLFESTAINVSRMPKHLPDVLRGLVWRARQQLNVFQIFMLLCLHGLCSLKSLEKPTACRTPHPPSVMYTKKALLCFDGARRFIVEGKDFVLFDDPNISWHSSDGPLDWLAIMIAGTTTY